MRLCKRNTWTYKISIIRTKRQKNIIFEVINIRNRNNCEQQIMTRVSGRYLYYVGIYADVLHDLGSWTFWKRSFQLIKEKNKHSMSDLCIRVIFYKLKLFERNDMMIKFGVTVIKVLTSQIIWFNMSWILMWKANDFLIWLTEKSLLILKVCNCRYNLFILITIILIDLANKVNWDYCQNKFENFKRLVSISGVYFINRAYLHKLTYTFARDHSFTNWTYYLSIFAVRPIVIRESLFVPRMIIFNVFRQIGGISSTIWTRSYWTCSSIVNRFD